MPTGRGKWHRTTVDVQRRPATRSLSTIPSAPQSRTKPETLSLSIFSLLTAVERQPEAPSLRECLSLRSRLLRYISSSALSFKETTATPAEERASARKSDPPSKSQTSFHRHLHLHRRGFRRRHILVCTDPASRAKHALALPPRARPESKTPSPYLCI